MPDTAPAPGAWNDDAPLPRAMPGGRYLISGRASSDAATRVRKRRRDGVSETVVSVLVERDPDEVDEYPPAATLRCTLYGPAADVEHAASLCRGDPVRAVGFHHHRPPVRYGRPERMLWLTCIELGPARVH